MKAAKKKNIFASEILPNLNNSKILIVEKSTKSERELFNLTKRKYQSTFKFIWLRNGVTHVRRTENSNYITIRSERDFDKLSVTNDISVQRTPSTSSSRVNCDSDREELGNDVPQMNTNNSD